MRQITAESQLVGKTITKAILLNDNFVLHFDNEFCQIESFFDGDILYLEITTNNISTIPTINNYEDLFYKGFIDRDTYDKFNEMYLESIKEKQKNNELEQYRKLQEKYGKL